ncbi:MAG: hypothetical protein M1819_003340 [Sarea resinae]|nr:MAG: hypothetical protein M1819_003340 [Sarea resinae]
MPESTAARDALTNRKLPEMQLSDGSFGSMTGPPPPMPHYLDATGRALRRFAVEGNAVVTGGTGTLALEGARALLEHGLTGLALWDVNPAPSSVDALRKDFPHATVFATRVNVRDSASVDSAMEELVARLGSVDHLCCFAGVVGCTHAIEMGSEEWRRTLDINTTGAFLCAQAVAKQMVHQKTPGTITLIASISAHRVNYPQPQSAYNVSKAAVLALKSSLAAEWARHGIRVNSLSPGYMDTILNAGDGLADARRSWAERNPMGRMGLPEELAGPLVLLVGAAGSYINGADLVVDGECFIVIHNVTRELGADDRVSSLSRWWDCVLSWLRWGIIILWATSGDNRSSSNSIRN